MRPGFTPTDLELSKDGDLLVSGLLGAGGAGVARFDAAGSPDSAFGGGDGFVEMPEAEAITELDNGDILVMDLGFSVTKLEADGDVVAGFDSEAIDLVGASSRALDVLPDGGFTIAGSSDSGSFDPPDLAVAVFNSDGSLRDDFAADGAISYPSTYEGADDTAASIEHHEGRLVVFGTTYNILPARPGVSGIVARINPDGALDPTFAGDGWMTPALGEYNAIGGGFITDDVIVATGRVDGIYVPNQPDWPDAFTSAVNHDGSPATEFPENGLFDTDILDLPNSAGRSAAEPGGERFLTTGWIEQSSDSDVVVTSYTLGNGPSDRDGDSVLDDSDICPSVHGPSPAGCPSFERDLEMKKRRGTFFVSVARADNSRVTCAQGETVVLRRISRPRKRVATEDFPLFNDCFPREFSRPGREGRYVALVKEATAPRSGHLSSARSNTIRVGR